MPAKLSDAAAIAAAVGFAQDGQAFRSRADTSRLDVKRRCRFVLP
jgi:hypothetical protein